MSRRSSRLEKAASGEAAPVPKRSQQLPKGPEPPTGAEVAGAAANITRALQYHQVRASDIQIAGPFRPSPCDVACMCGQPAGETLLVDGKETLVERLTCRRTYLINNIIRKEAARDHLVLQFVEYSDEWDVECTVKMVVGHEHRLYQLAWMSSAWCGMDEVYKTGGWIVLCQQNDKLSILRGYYRLMKEDPAVMHAMFGAGTKEVTDLLCAIALDGLEDCHRFAEVLLRAAQQAHGELCSVGLTFITYDIYIFCIVFIIFMYVRVCWCHAEPL